MTEIVAWQRDCPGRLVVRSVEAGLEATCYVEEEPPPVVNLVQNGDFQDKEHWRLNPAIAANWVVVGGVAGLTVTSAAKVVQFYQTGIALTPGKRYRLVVWARADVDRTIEVALHKHDSPYTGYGLQVPLALTTTWQPFTVEFAATISQPVQDGRLRLTVRNATPGHWYEFDDVKLIELV